MDDDRWLFWGRQVGPLVKDTTFFGVDRDVTCSIRKRQERSRSEQYQETVCCNGITTSGRSWRRVVMVLLLLHLLATSVMPYWMPSRTVPYRAILSEILRYLSTLACLVPHKDKGQDPICIIHLRISKPRLVCSLQDNFNVDWYMSPWTIGKQKDSRKTQEGLNCFP